ncbi:Tryptophan decarboxylase [Rubrobacter xylanophilus DSM 9941]|uniref:pyridoxal phosphate-dependent decarboxylase family protein n=1 Tax=Rubrobacter xylanophilus TaxID=49319 RepID=UPI001C63C855|nr:aminotransferase class V-fold PLP-dependent enzyme [Rubrobacter xylanophilus]QYJ14263.1 Tryptophan decarboxylase [Rubrobacter xylanophilus DSM 9941]
MRRREARSPSTPQHERADLPALADREGVLEELVRVICEAWTSFDAPRPAEPQLGEELAARLVAPLPEGPGDVEDALSDAARVLDASVSPSRPLNLGYIGSTGLEMGVLGSALAATYDVNLAVTAGGADLVEEQALRWLADFVGFPLAEGSFTSGGMTSNLTALLAARERALPGSRADGLHGRRAAAYCSEEAHHSVVRAVEVCGLGNAAVRRIPLDDRRRMRPDALDAAISRDAASGITPVAVVATAGTTLTGAVDPLDDVADVCGRHGVWMHVDGAYGLPAAAVPETAPLFAGLERADSTTVDAHKWLGVQKSCSAVMLRETGRLRAAFGHEERYMLHEGDVPNPVDRTLEYSRPLRSLRLWMALRVHGAAQYRIWIKRTLDNARHLTGLLREAPDFELLHEPMLSTVCFRHAPSGLRDPDAHNLRLAREMQRDGRVFLAPASVDGRACLRACFVNFRTTARDVERILPVAREVGGRLVRP